MKKVISNNKLTSKSFWESFNRLSGLDCFDGKTTVSIFKLRKQMAQEVEIIKDSISGGDYKSTRQVLDLETTIETNLELEMFQVADRLSSTDLFQLEPLFS